MRTSRLRVVILDDEEFVRAAYSMILRHWFEAIDLHMFGDAASAWDELARNEPDLFITDIHHAGMSCSEMLGRS